VLISSPTPILGGQATGRLVSFQINSGYDSYGKSKGNNAPISRKADAAYTTALKNLSAEDSKNKFIIGNRTLFLGIFGQ
jgi:CRISPR-associated protein Csd1